PVGAGARRHGSATGGPRALPARLGSLDLPHHHDIALCALDDPPDPRWRTPPVAVPPAVCPAAARRLHRPQRAVVLRPARCRDLRTLHRTLRKRPSSCQRLTTTSGRESSRAAWGSASRAGASRVLSP